MSKQVFVLSIIGLILSMVYGIGLLFLIPVLVQCINIKINYITYNVEVIDKTIVYCIAGMVLSIMIILVNTTLIPSL